MSHASQRPKIYGEPTVRDLPSEIVHLRGRDDAATPFRLHLSPRGRLEDRALRLEVRLDGELVGAGALMVSELLQRHLPPILGEELVIWMDGHGRGLGLSFYFRRQNTILYAPPGGLIRCTRGDQYRCSRRRLLRSLIR